MNNGAEAQRRAVYSNSAKSYINIYIACIVMSLTIIISCDGQQKIRVNVDGISDNFLTLEVNAFLNEKSATNTQYVKDHPSTFLVELPYGSAGHLRLVVTEQDKLNCPGAQGNGEIYLTGSMSYEVNVSLKPFAEKSCQLTIEQGGFGKGDIQVDPRGLTCRAGEKCEFRFQAGTRVTLTAKTGVLAEWSANCKISNGKCTIPITPESINVRARWGGPGYAIWGSGPNDVWAIGAQGTILRWNGSVWTSVDSGTYNYIVGIWGSDPNNVWIVGDIILNWDGTSWKSSNRIRESLQSIWGRSRNDVWAAGSQGTVVRWDGVNWNVVPSGTSVQLWGIWGNQNSEEVWIVGDSGTILKWNGRALQIEKSETSTSLWGIWGSRSDDVWAVGREGIIIRWNGQVWKVVVPQGTTPYLDGIWGSGPNNVWAVGASKTLRWDGVSWSSVPRGTSSALRSIWGSGANDVWTVGIEGIIYRWDGVRWQSSLRSQ